MAIGRLPICLECVLSSATKGWLPIASREALSLLTDGLCSLEAAILVAERIKPSAFLPSCEPYIQQYQPAKPDGPPGTIVAWLL